MNLTEFRGKLEELLDNLGTIAQECCFNSLSKNQAYLLSKIDINNHSDQRNPFLLRSAEVAAKKHQKRFNFEEVKLELFSIYPDLYDVNATVFQSFEHRTIVEFSYVLKSDLGEEHLSKWSDCEPMYHAKLARPYLMKDETAKFDINWQHQPWRNWWRRFRYQMKERKF